MLLKVGRHVVLTDCRALSVEASLNRVTIWGRRRHYTIVSQIRFTGHGGAKRLLVILFASDKVSTYKCVWGA